MYELAAYTFLFASHTLRIHKGEQNYTWSIWKQLKVALYTGRTIVVRHAVDESSPHCRKLTVDSFYMLLGVYYSSLPATSVVLWLRYTLNKLDTSSNGIYAVRNPRVGYVTTALRFLNHVDPLNSVSNYYVKHTFMCLIVCVCHIVYR